MSDDLIQQIADLRREVAQLQRERVTYRAATVTAADPATSTFTATLPDGSKLEGIGAPEQFLPVVGDSVRLTLSGATPIYANDGSVFQTAAAGQRVVVAQVGNVGAVRMFSDASDQVGASLSCAVDPEEGKFVELAYGLDPATGIPGPRLSMLPGQAFLSAAAFEIAAPTFVGNTLRAAFEPVGSSDVVTKGYLDQSQWVTLAEGASSYNYTVTATITSLPQLAGSVFVPVGRQLEVEAFFPIVAANSGGIVRPRLHINNAGKASGEVYGATSGVNAPVTLSATFAGTDTTIPIAAAAYGAGTFGQIRGVNDSTPGPRLRYRLI